MHPTFSYFTLMDGSVITYDVPAGSFLLGGVEHKFPPNNTEALQEFLERFESVEELRTFLYEREL